MAERWKKLKSSNVFLSLFVRWNQNRSAPVHELLSNNSLSVSCAKINHTAARSWFDLLYNWPPNSELLHNNSLLELFISNLDESSQFIHFIILVPLCGCLRVQYTLIFCVLFLFGLVFTSKGNIENCPASKHEIRWLLILSWRNSILLGSYPKQSATLFAIAKSPQSMDPCCCWTVTLFTVTMVPSYFNIAEIWLFTWESGSKFKLSLY